MSELTVTEFEELCHEVFKRKEEIETVKKQLAELQLEYTALQSSMLAAFELYGKEKHHVAGLGTISSYKRLSVKVPTEPSARAQFFQYLRDRGIFDEAITVHSAKLNALYKEEMRIAAEENQGDYQMPGVGEPVFYETLQVRRG